MPIVSKLKKATPKDDQLKHLPRPLSTFKGRSPALPSILDGANIGIFHRTCKALEEKVFSFNIVYSFRAIYVTNNKNNIAKINI